MRRPRWTLFALAVLPLAVVTAFLFAADPEEGKKYALLVGVKRYSDGTGLRDLEFTENDVNALAAVLAKQGYRVTVLTREEAVKQDKDFLRPTAENIRRHLAALTKACKGSDTLLVAVSGHGAHLKATNKLYFCPQDTDLKDEKKLLAVEEVMAAFDGKNCQAASKVLIMDACRNDPTDGKAGGAPPELGSLTRPLVPDLPGGTVALFSCSKGQISHESSTHKRGFLFHHVIEGLSGKAANKAGEVTWRGLTKYVEDELPSAVRSDKGPKVVQTPDFRGEDRAMVLAKVAVSDIAPAVGGGGAVIPPPPPAGGPRRIQVTAAQVGAYTSASANTRDPILGLLEMGDVGVELERDDVEKMVRIEVSKGGKTRQVWVSMSSVK